MEEADAVSSELDTTRMREHLDYLHRQLLLRRNQLETVSQHLQLSLRACSPSAQLVTGYGRYVG